MEIIKFAVAALLVTSLATSCRTQKTPSEAGSPHGVTEASSQRFDAGTDRSLVPSEERLAGQIRHEVPADRVHIIGGTPANAIPKGVAFKMSGDYADNLPLNLSPDGTLASYPAPSDITAESAPLPLAGGWWLDRRGVNASTVFSSYTLSEYASLPEAPSPEKLLASIIPGARVTAVERLPMSPVQAAADTAAVNAYLRGATFSLPAKR